MKGNLRKGLFFAISYVTVKWAAIVCLERIFMKMAYGVIGFC